MDWFLYDNCLRHEKVNYCWKVIHLDICGGTYYALTRVIIKGVGEHLENICRKMDGVYDNKWGMIFKNWGLLLNK